MSYSIGSLFDGSGGFPLAGTLCGMEPRWASEVEPYPIAVTRSRFPNMKHLGDISKVNGAEIDPVDVITFGSPCQDLSVAGRQAGMKHESNGDAETTRSGLFIEAVRIIREMRRATNGKHPNFAIWENVPGAFSSNKGEDFRTVLEEIIKINDPEAPALPSPEKGGWPYADCIMGDGWSIAYRTFDAQHWGVPQRRRRIYLVADFGGQRAGKVLFEREGLRGYFAESGIPAQRNTGKADGSTGATDRDGVSCYGICSYASNAMKSDNPHSGIYEAKTSRTLDLNGGNPACNQGGIAIVQGADEGHTFVIDFIGGQGEYGKESAVNPTLRAGAQGAVAYSVENHPNDSRVNIDESGKVQTLTSRMGTGGGNVPLIMEQHTIDRDVCDFIEDINRMAPHQQDKLQNPDKVAYALKAAGSDHTKTVINTGRRYIVRRLTPTECARLQGFADRWGDIEPKDDLTDEEHRFWQEVRNTHAAINGKTVKDYTKAQILTWYNKLHSDSAEYKMWGNGVALPTTLYVMQGIADALRERAA